MKIRSYSNVGKAQAAEQLQAFVEQYGLEMDDADGYSGDVPVEWWSHHKGWVVDWGKAFDDELDMIVAWAQFDDATHSHWCILFWLVG